MSVLQNLPLELDVFHKNTIMLQIFDDGRISDAKGNIPKISLGDKVKIIIYLELPQEIEAGGRTEKERIQAFEGIVTSIHLDGSNLETDATITVRKMFQGGGTEKVFVLNSPWIKSIDVLSNSIVRRSKLHYLRERTGKSARLKRRL